jgi:hypothetical protein
MCKYRRQARTGGHPERTAANAVLSRTTSAVYSSGGKTAPYTKRFQSTRRRLRAFFDRPPTSASNFFSYSSTLGGYPKKFFRVHSGGLLSSTAHLLTLIAALKSRFTNSIRFLPSFVVLTSASSPRTFALLSICSSVSGPYFFISSGLR